MKELKVYTNPKKNISYKLKKEATVIGLSMILATTSLTGCGKDNNKNHNITSNINALQEKEGLTYVDEYLSICDIEKLDKEFKEAYTAKKEDKCNDLLCEMSSLIVKALVAEGFNLNFAEIEDFEILGKMLYDIDPDAGKVSSPEYGIHFKYEGKKVNYEAPKGSEIRDILFIHRAALQRQLVFNKKDTSSPELSYMESAYNKIADSLEITINYNNKKHRNEYSKEDKGYKYNGFIKSKVNRKKSKAIKEYEKKIKVDRNKSQRIKEYQNIKTLTLKKCERGRNKPRF